jgi:ferrochelatase
MTCDHLLVIGFGGPTRPEDVTPFLEEVTRGLPIPPARLAEVARHYHMTGGASPYNEYASRLVEKLKTRLREDGVSLPVFIGMRNWHPFVKETMRTIKAQRLKHGVGIILAPHRCEASFEKYLQNVEEAKRHASAGEITYEYLGPWHDHPLFIQAQADEVRAVLDRISPTDRNTTHLLFSAHSIPVEMARSSRYEEESRTSCELVANVLRHAAWSLAYQSRSGHPGEPWLEPDVRSAIRQLQERGVRRVLLIPIGFLLDHTEVLYDLDIDAKEHAQRVGVEYLRASTVMDHPRLIEMFSRLIRDQLAAASPLAR